MLTGSNAGTMQVEIEFHGVQYLLTVSTPDDETLVIDIEDKESLARWHGGFSAKCKA